MKRIVAAVALLVGLCALFKLTVKGRDEARTGPIGPAASVATDPAVDHAAELAARYPDRAEMVRRVYDAYRQNALAVERTDGVRGLALLDALGVEAIFLYERHPNDFGRLREAMGDAAAADLLLHWREYFSLKHADDLDRRVLIGEVARLSPAHRKVAARYPNVLPLLLAEPEGVAEFIGHWSGSPKDLEDALALLGFISLEPGSADLRAALRTLDARGPLALDAFRVQGLDGFALVGLYGDVLQELGRAIPLDQALILLRVNSGYVDGLLRTHRPATVAGHLRHVAAARLVEAVGGSPDALRLVVEGGEPGVAALRAAGPDAADVAYGDFTDQATRNQAVAALAEHGRMALAILDKYADDPDFREILRAHGPRVIPPIAAVDANPETLALLRSKADLSWKEWMARGVLSVSSENGQATIRLIKTSGLDRVAELNSSQVEFYQLLPFYDLFHLGSVVGRGHAPTSGEMAWAMIDGCFVIFDALSLTSLQPEGAAAAEAARSEMKSAAKVAAKAAGREMAEDAGVALARRTPEGLVLQASKWCAVRSVGGTYAVLKRLPEALGRLSVTEAADLGRALCLKAGFRLSRFAPMTFIRKGVEVVQKIPPGKAFKYVGVQLAQAGVGVVGIAKMEEHLKSRRPSSN